MTKTNPSINTAKLLTGSVGASTDLLATTTEVAMPTPDGIGAFRTVCEFSHMAFDDPIVHPGQPGASHLHAFFGNTGTNAYSTAATLASTGNSTCFGGTVNRTGYWVPAIIDTKDGSPVLPDKLITYYKTGYNGIAPKSVNALPQGLRMIAGDSTRSSELVWGPTSFLCINNVTAVGPRTWSLPNCAAGTETMWAVVTFPQCWDGVNLDSPDHKSHMAYPSGGACPSTHPVAVPEVTMNVLYTVKEANAPLRWRMASDNYSTTIPAGYSSHADWFNGWKADIMATWIKNCDQAAKDCQAHLLGDGRMMVAPTI